MKKNSIVYPFQLCRDNFRSYAFAVELARKLNRNLTLLVTYLDPKLRINIPGRHKKRIDRIKERIYFFILEMNGLYHGTYNQWEIFDEVKIETLIKEGSMENALYSSLSKKEYSFLLLDAKMISGNILSELTLKKLSTKITNLCVLPENNQPFKLDPNSPLEFFDFQKKNLFNELLWKTKLYKLPDDINAFYKDFFKLSEKKISLNNSFTDSIFC